jgi:Ca-activated chloride channel family protein
MMRPRSLANVTAAAVLGLSVASTAAAGAPESPGACIEDAMIVFDASGSMSGNEKLGIATTVTRIDEVRSALAKVLPEATRFRRVGLISYGPGPYNQCNFRLNLKPCRTPPHASWRK